MIDARSSTWPEIESAWRNGKIAIVAFGAQEEHGPHCPLATDTILSAGLAARLAAALDAVLLPPVPYGETWSTSGYPGTVTFSAETVASIVRDIGASLTRQGARALVIVNGHFGNRAPIERACGDLRRIHSFPVLLVDYPGLEELAAGICVSAPAGPSFYHADEVETSLVLALDPGTVHMDRAVAEYPTFPANFGAEPVLLNTFCASGVFGDPRPATAEKGVKLLDGLTARSLAVIEEFLRRL